MRVPDLSLPSGLHSSLKTVIVLCTILTVAGHYFLVKGSCFLVLGCVWGFFGLELFQNFGSPSAFVLS